MPTPDSAPTAPDSAQVVRVLLALTAACKALRFYPPTNPQVHVTLQRLRQALGAAVGQGNALVLEVQRDRFASAGSDLGGLESDLSRLAFKLHCLNVRELDLLPGLGDDEVVALAGILNQPYETLVALGPLDQTLSVRGVSHALVRYAETIATGRSGEARSADPPIADGFLRKPRFLLELLSDPGLFAREIVRRCVEVVPAPGEKRLDAQLAYVDRFLQATAAAIETEPAETRPELYARLSNSLDALIRSADVSGAKMGGLPRVDLTHIDPRVLEVLPQRDLVKEVSSKVKMHQGATTVMASALRQLKLQTSTEGANPVLDVIENRQEAARSVATNIQVLDEIRAGQEVDGEYPGIVYAERDRNKNFSLGVALLDGSISAGERRQAQQIVDDLDDWRPELDSVETVLDMLFNESNPNFVKMITDRLVEKLMEFLSKGELEPALVILRGLNMERPRRREDPQSRPILEAALAHVEEPAAIERLLRVSETLPVESPAFENVKSFLFLLDKRVVHTLVEIVAADNARYSRRRTLALSQFLCRNRLDLLAEGLRSPRPEVVRTFAWLLGRFGPEAVGHLRRAAHHPEPRVRREVARSLAAIEDPESTRVLAALLADRDDATVQTALRTLVSRAGADALAGIEAALADDAMLDRQETTALQIVRAAARLGDGKVLAALRRLEDRGRRRWSLKGNPLRDAIREASRELQARLSSPPPAAS